MNKRMILYILAMLLLIEAAFMLLPLAAGLVYAEKSCIYFVYTIAGMAAVGAALMRLAKPKNKNIYAKEGLLTV
ncbi:MAG: TrkH family potassium uptake protein, partial [Oscillospiraceae bacterium]|nr:TrkH family potassium uptake protein [Oscillospiraceae bacterium]